MLPIEGNQDTDISVKGCADHTKVYGRNFINTHVKDMIFVTSINRNKTMD